MSEKNIQGIPEEKQGIGAFNDDIKLLEVAITYLKESTYNKMIEA